MYYYLICQFQTHNQNIEQNENVAQLMNEHHPPTISEESSLGVLYPILSDYAGLELSVLAQNKSVAIPTQIRPIEVTNGVRKVETKIIINYK